MKITNNYNLPDIVLRAMEKSRKAYSKGTARLSVTQLISPPQISVLKAKHHDEMEGDAADQFWSLLGSAVHQILEDGAEHEIVEQRLHAVVNGWEISGAIDVQEETEHGIQITDYKVTSAYKIMKQDYSDWEKQQNIYAWLIHKNTGKHVTNLRICAIVRDWQKSNIGREQNYPLAPMSLIYLPVWDLADTEAYLVQRVAKHQEAALAAKLGLDLPPCTPEEQWAQAEVWALKKEGQARALKLYYNQEEAERALDFQSATKTGGKGDVYVEHRPGKRTRCEGDYCGVARWCLQRKRELGG